MVPQNTTLRVAVLDDKHRFRVPIAYSKDWEGDGPVLAMPLVWSRDLQLSQELRLQAWILEKKGLGIGTARTEDYDSWRVHPNQVKEEPSSYRLSEDLARLIIEMPVDKHNGAWRVGVPKNMRDLGWLPKAGQKIIICTDYSGLSVWTNESFNLHSSNSTERWAELFGD